jgi:hypothetical protein
METTNNQKPSNLNKKVANKNVANKNIKVVPIKVYFPDISLKKLNDTIYPSKKIGNKLSKVSICDISKYLVEESSNITIYSSKGIFEVINNNLLQLYPIDATIKEMIVNHNLKLLLDSSYMKRCETPSYQIPYYHTIKYKTIKTYKNDTNSNIKFIIEMENESIYDFYVLITSKELTNNDNKTPELSKFAKDEILSFLSRLNLYR